MALGSIVALLPEDYKIKISTEEYKKAIQEQSFIVCGKCNHKNQSNQIEYYDVKLYGLDKLAAGKPSVRVWNCLKCKHENRKDNSKIIISEPELPFYTGWIPHAPAKRVGIIDRMSYPKEFMDWFEIAIHEIESKIGIYRADYLAQNPDAKDVFGEDEK